MEKEEEGEREIVNNPESWGESQKLRLRHTVGERDRSKAIEERRRKGRLRKDWGNS